MGLFDFLKRPRQLAPAPQDIFKQAEEWRRQRRQEKAMTDIELLVTLWPSFPHFGKFVADKRITGIRLNSAMMTCPELDKELDIVAGLPAGSAPLFYDIKSRQPRVVEVIPNNDHLDIRMNHPVEVAPGAPIIFKGGMDVAVLDHTEEDGRRLIFGRNPTFQVKAGESLCIRAPHKILGNPFTEAEREKIAKVRAAGFTKWFLSYVEEQSDVDEFRELVGKDADVWLKIENERGLRYVAEDFTKDDRTTLVAARGDLYVEIQKPHMMSKALRLIVDKDPFACAASRLLLSVIEKEQTALYRYEDEDGNVFYMPQRVEEKAVTSPYTGRVGGVQPPVKALLSTTKNIVNPVPSCADFMELQWLYDVGYRRFMLCDELCLRGDLLGTAVNAFGAWRSSL